MKRFSFIGIFFLGLIVGLLLEVNTIAQETKAKVQIQEEDRKIRLSDVDKKLDQVLANQDVILKEIKRVFARIH